jgi:eukaryotic-like serine/threonine-protein kinase
MSEVRRGEDVLLGRPVAIKLLLDDGDPRSAARFQQEAQILARLQHPNVITVFDSGADGGERFIVMELVEGPTLRKLLDTEGRLAPERAVEIASRLASALEFAHGKGVIHRDVKPSNVLLPPGGGVKLADMGIARLLSPEALTATLSVRGTAAYISPEQVRGDRVDARADLYSLGCVLFEMLTGRTPFEGDLAALSYAHTHTPAPRVRSVNPAVPAAMDELVAAIAREGSRPPPVDRRRGPEVSCLSHEPRRRADRGDGAGAAATLTLASPAGRRASETRTEGMANWRHRGERPRDAPVHRDAGTRRTGRPNGCVPTVAPAQQLAGDAAAFARGDRVAHTGAAIACGDQLAGTGAAVAPGGRRDRARYR